VTKCIEHIDNMKLAISIAEHCQPNEKTIPTEQLIFVYVS